MESLVEKIFSKISRNGRGWVFSPDEFHDLGEPRVVGVALSRMVYSQRIRRLARGLYDYPKTTSGSRELDPSPDAVAQALAGRHNIRLIPAGEYAADILGLSQHVPTELLFLTDGPSRKVKLGGQGIRLKHTTPRNLGAAGRMSGIVIQALRHLGSQSVSESTIRKLRNKLSAEEKKQLLRDQSFAPAWVRIHLQAIAREEA